MKYKTASIDLGCLNGSFGSFDELREAINAKVRELFIAFHRLNSIQPSTNYWYVFTKELSGWDVILRLDIAENQEDFDMICNRRINQSIFEPGAQLIQELLTA